MLKHYEDQAHATQLFNKGNELHSAKNYTLALQHFMKAATDYNHQPSMHNIGSMHYNGNGTPKNFHTSIAWFDKLPDSYADISKVYFLKGHMFLVGGYGIRRDHMQARVYCIKSANKGFVSAQTLIGYLYVNGFGVEKDYATAIEYFESAIGQGNAHAAIMMGDMYRKGRGVPLDYNLAMQYYNSAFNKGEISAIVEIGYMYHQGYGVTRDYQRAFECYMTAINDQLDSKDSYCYLGLLYRDGLGVPQDYQRALDLFMKGSDDSVDGGQSMAAMGDAYVYGHGLNKDYKIAMQWYRTALDSADCASGQMGIGKLYMDGLGVPKDLNIGLEWFKKALNNEHPEAAYYIEKINFMRVPPPPPSPTFKPTSPSSQTNYAPPQQTYSPPFPTYQSTYTSPPPAYQSSCPAEPNTYSPTYQTTPTMPSPTINAGPPAPPPRPNSIAKPSSRPTQEQEINNMQNSAPVAEEITTSAEDVIREMREAARLQEEKMAFLMAQLELQNAEIKALKSNSASNSPKLDIDNVSSSTTSLKDEQKIGDDTKSKSFSVEAQTERPKLFNVEDQAKEKPKFFNVQSSKTLVHLKVDSQVTELKVSETSVKQTKKPVKFFQV